MAARRFKFVSPGVFINEIDNSHLPDDPTEVGPVIVGRTQYGPALRPVTVTSFSDFVDVFGEPHPGSQGGDVWREGNKLAPTYAAYAAQAWLKNNSPATIVRLLGKLWRGMLLNVSPVYIIHFFDLSGLGCGSTTTRRRRLRF